MSSRDETTDRIAAAMRVVIADSVLTNERIARGIGLNVVDLQTFGVLSYAEAPLSPGEIATRTGLPTSTVTRVLDRLESAGYVERHPDPSDRRRVIVRVFPERLMGRMSENPYAGIVAQMAAFHEGFSAEELAVVARYLEGMAAAEIR